MAVALSVGMAMLLAEVAMRIAGLNFAAPYQPDPYCGSRLTPNVGFWNLSEGRVYVTTNRAGFRDREHAVSKPAGTFRIAVLGDSFAEAVQVPQREAFWSVMERELAGCAEFQGKTVEVLNFGVSGYGTTQELQMLRHYVWQYEPDLVLLAFLPGNDVRNNSRALEPEQGKPFYDLVDGALVLDETFRDQRLTPVVQVKDWLVRHVRVLSAIYRAKENWKTARVVTEVKGNEAGLDDGVFGTAHNAEWEHAWAITEAVLRTMYDEVAAHGARFFVVEMNNALQVDPNPDRIAATAKRLGVADLEEPDRRLARLAAERGFSFLSLTEPMRQVAQRDQIYFHGFANTSPGSGHWNEQGHNIAGKLIAAALCDSGIISDSNSTPISRSQEGSP